MTLLFLGIFSLMFMILPLRSHLTVSMIFRFMILHGISLHLPCKWRFLKPSSDTQKKHQAAHGYIQKPPKKVCRACVRNGTKIVVRVEQWRNGRSRWWGSKAHQLSSRHHGSLTNLRDFLIVDPYSHKHRRIVDFSPCEPTSCRWRLL